MNENVIAEEIIQSPDEELNERKNGKKAAKDKAKAALVLSRVFVYILLILLTIICIFPFYILFVNATRSHYEITSSFSFIPGDQLLINISHLATRKSWVYSALFNSLMISTVCALFTAYFSALTAYGLHVYRFKGKNFFFTFIMLVMMVPSQVSAAGFVKIVYGIKAAVPNSLFLNTYLPLVLPSVAAPVVFFFMKQYLESVLPYEVVEAARVDGSGEFRTFNQIVLPMIKPALAVQLIFTFVTTWNNYFIPQLIIRDDAAKTIPILIATLRSNDPTTQDVSLVYTAIFMAIIPILLVYLVLSKWIIGGVTLGSVKG